MHFDDNQRGLSPAQRDAIFERAVLEHILVLHPTHLRLPQLAAQVIGGAREFYEDHGVERAIRELTRAGLIEVRGVEVLPTKAALRLDCLLSRPR
ncbi:MAG TPA: hypothetical protein VHQ43_01215 [Solirubrobacterales bacterium]|jgi:hypothetical protein|nr:hypothetical protein [Solirubrobacterales bacterium]